MENKESIFVKESKSPHSIAKLEGVNFSTYKLYLDKYDLKSKRLWNQLTLGSKPDSATY